MHPHPRAINLYTAAHPVLVSRNSLRSVFLSPTSSFSLSLSLALDRSLDGGGRRSLFLRGQRGTRPESVHREQVIRNGPLKGALPKCRPAPLLPGQGFPFDTKKSRPIVRLFRIILGRVAPNSWLGIKDKAAVFVDLTWLSGGTEFFFDVLISDSTVEEWYCYSTWFGWNGQLIIISVIF